ncbi:CCR4 NOT transcription complex subunit 2 [Fasciola hepatica]|uniref:CCR4 NOT transcription complex subunit 2 n=1 Tax=Fasciola hepatica TaxID=6192 RepID=A0A4E0QZK4_FASHE|nr:CCR4 NOT transcription complex subunit 2 [Fasciola hepatica]
MDYAVPPEYLIRHLIADRLPDPPMDQLSEETLFWLFYNCCREETQLVVAKELYQREWRFHKKEKIWLTRNVNANFTTDNSSEQGDYFYWDPLKAQKSTLHMTILYSDLDNAPKSFRLSSGTLNAFVSTGLTTNSTAHHTHHSNAHTNMQHLQLATAYQQQQQQQQQQNYNPHQSLLPGNHDPTNSGNTALVNTLHHSASGPLLGQGNSTSATSGSAANLSTLFNSNARQAPKAQVSQISPSATYIQPAGMPHGRSAATLTNPVGPMFASRSGPTGTQQSISPTATANVTTMVPGLIAHNSGPASSAAAVAASTAALSNPNATSGTGSSTFTTITTVESGAIDSSTVRSATGGANLVVTSLSGSVANDHPSVSASAGGSSSPLDASAQL